MNKTDNEWLRRRKDQLYIDMVELNDDSDRLKKLASSHPIRKYRNKFLQLSYAIDDQVDGMDEACIAIELHLKNLGKKK